MKITLETIILCNFKSYIGETIIGLAYPFTTIIGPNGCGKSNIVDAVRFVLGDVLNTLRVKRFSELVHSDPAGKPATGSAYVTIIFLIDDNKKKSFSRIIQGEVCQYKIDDEIVTSELYMTTLQEYGLDIKSEHFLVSQGFVECITLKTPKELTAMFEQISGSDVYKADYKRLQMKLTQIENEVQLAQYQKKQLLMNKKYVITEKEEAETYLKLQEQYKNEKLQYQLIHLFLIKKTIENLQNEDADIKFRTEEYLYDKENKVITLGHQKLQFKLLTDSFEDTEQRILKLENAIQEQKAEYAVLEEKISYHQKKRDCACASLEKACLAYDINKKTTAELKNELKQIDKKLADIKNVSEQSAVELSDLQIKQYFELKNTIECQAKDFVEQINSFNRDQEVDHNRLDNEDRRKQELEDKVKRTKETKENLKTRLKKLQNVITESRMTLTEKIIEKQELNDKITEMNNRSLSLKDGIAKVLEKLNEMSVDNYTISRQKKKTETIKMLKKSYSGVHDRLSNLCRPIHSRYKIAVVKVFGKFMDAIVVDTINIAVQCINFLKEHEIGVETFLPLDSLKQEILKESLRDIENVKLLYDILSISSPQINKAVLFVTKNTLVCETPEGARRVAYEIGKRNHNCISLDGTFYRKDGTMSGGEADLISKAKQWEQQEIIALKEQTDQLKKELGDLPNVSLLQSELSDIDVQIKGLSLRNNLIGNDLKSTEDEIAKIHEELIEYDTELSLLNETISKIHCDMQARDEKLEDVKRHVSAIEDSVFADFCRSINVPNISYYEKNYLWIYQERRRRQIELENQHDLIRNQLRFEKNRDMKDKISKWTCIMEQADTTCTEMRQQEHFMKTAVEQQEEELSKLREEYTIVKENLVDVEKEMAECKSQIDAISKLYMKIQKEGIIVRKKIEQQKIECDSILKECKMENITIPILPETISSKSGSSSSSSFMDSSIDWDMSKLKVDFSQFPGNILDSTEENLQDMAKQLSEKLTEIQNELKMITNPNLKAEENMDSVMQKIRETNKTFKELREKADRAKKQFEAVKMKRSNLFSKCLECVEIDSVYKSLVNHTSASALIISDNPEEPYQGGINYNCTPPMKGFQPLENLSGGEKTFAGLALLFALQRNESKATCEESNRDASARSYKPAPFIIMDEVDAALDKRNIKNLVRFIQSQGDTAQFIIVSHQKSLYNCSDALVGVTTQSDAEYTQSRAFGISLRGYKDRR